MLILIPLGVMKVAARVAVACLVFAETVVPHGRGIGVVVSTVLIGRGSGCRPFVPPIDDVGTNIRPNRPHR